MITETCTKRLFDSGMALDQTQLQQLADYCALLLEWNEKMNLTAITKEEDIYEKHFLDSLLAMPKELHGKVCDVGSGAGFPGIVWKIACPDIELTLLEPTAKRVRFLDEVIRTLKLKQVETVNLRAEDYVKTARESFDLVTARAVASLNVLAELCLPLVKPQGRFLAMKGSQGMAEYEEAKNAIQLLGGSLVSEGKQELSDGALRYNLVIQKEKSTPQRYPRRYDQIKKKPL